MKEKDNRPNAKKCLEEPNRPKQDLSVFKTLKSSNLKVEKKD